MYPVGEFYALQLKYQQYNHVQKARNLQIQIYIFF